MKRFLQAYGFLFVLSGAVIVLDQVSKYWVRANIPLEGIWSPWPWLTPYARLVHWYNTGVVFGLFQGKGDIFAVLAIIVSIAIVYYFPRIPPRDWPLRIALGLQLGGAIGNLIDRIVLGHVIDFISIWTFAVFNIADASITMGVIVLIAGIIVEERQRRKPIQGHVAVSSETGSGEGLAR
ncbi:MAG: signal peptidase II [Anaerolineales bacterium]